MSRALLAYNPEAHRSAGASLLFGIALPPPRRRFGFTALEELDLATHFLEARSGPPMAALLEHILRRVGTVGGRAVDPLVARSLLRRLIPAANTVRAALQPALQQGAAVSPEAIFGAELEGLSPEDQEFETARHFVRFAAEASRLAASAAPGAAPDTVAWHAENLAARRHAPGLPGALGPLHIDFRSRRRARLGQ